MRRYDSVGTRAKLDETMVLLKLSVPTMELRDVVAPPPAGYGATDPFGFAHASAADVAALPSAVRRLLASDSFKQRFRAANKADYTLYWAAEKRLEEQVAGFGPQFTRHLEWYQGLNKWVTDRLRQTEAYQRAMRFPVPTATPEPCPVGSEMQCAQALVTQSGGDRVLREQAQHHAGEGCLFLNEGCFGQLLLDLTLAEYKHNAAKKAGMGGSGSGKSEASLGVAPDADFNGGSGGGTAVGTTEVQRASSTPA